MDKLNPRQESILELARQAGRVSVDELASRLKVTTQTIRKDLNEMGSRRLLSRVHGGAVIASGVENLAYEARRFINQAEKQAIGRAAAALIPDNASLFVNIGTTTEEVARALQDHHGLLVITNNLNVATLLYPHPRIEVIIAGGPVRRADGAVIGKAAVDFIRQFKVDHAIVGVSAIDSDGALLDFDFREVQVARAIIENARQTILVADRMKFERSAPVRIGHLSDIDVLVTDRLPNAEIAGTCAAKGVRVIEVGGASDEGGG
ncbi:transcriptional regulator, DeoR family [Rhizobiales bacterium GAS113]|nr:transcriptional regulator, DeoR family [Rhizobiales bacterium GAS113]